ncbi:MAG: redoxin domain-containing protein [Bacteroidales bacterium]|nr:redoxin domain-containing protein [Bacteroidales bacterium]
MPDKTRTPAHSLKGLFLTALVFLFSAICSFAQKPSGVYDIRLDCSDWFKYQNSKHFGDFAVGRLVYLKKYSWGKLVTIDSAVVNKKGIVSFKGLVYPLDLSKDQNNLFTSGQYQIYHPHWEKVNNFFYSPSNGGNFKETFVLYEGSNNGGNKYLQNGEVWRKKPRRDKYGPENDIYLHSCQLMDSVSEYGRMGYSPNFQVLLQKAKKEAPNSLAAIYLSFKVRDLGAGAEDRMADIADERLYYTEFGKQILDIFLDKFKLSTESVRNMAIDYLMENRYLTDPKMRAATAMECFRRYSSSIVMGCEGSAVYVAEKYIIGNNDISEKDRAEAAWFDTVNKGTLVGAKAPELNLKDTAGVERSVSEMMGDYSIIYFYSDDCNHCKVETPRFLEFLDNYKFSPLNVMTVYTGTDANAWKEYVKENFATINPFVNWLHVADIDRESKFPVDYGVVSTPKMFLLDHSLRIKGRGILTPTLKIMLDDEELKAKQAVDYLSVIFPRELSYPEDVETELRKHSVDQIAEGTAGNIESFRELIRHTYMFLMNSDLYPDQEAAAYTGEKYICGMREKWEDTVFVHNVCDAVSAYNKNKLGSKATNLMLYDVAGFPIELLSPEGEYKVLVFYKTTCGVCTEMLPKLFEIWNKYRRAASFTAIYVGQDETAWRKYLAQHENFMVWRQLWDKDALAGLAKKYDIETTPHIYIIDPEDIVIAKDIDTADLEEALKIICNK